MSILHKLFKREVKNLYNEKKKLDTALELLISSSTKLQTSPSFTLLEKELRRLIDRKMGMANTCFEPWLLYNNKERMELELELEEVIKEIFKGYNH